MSNITKCRYQQLAAAYRAGRKTMMVAGYDPARRARNNPYSVGGRMPERLVSLQGALWHAWDAGAAREQGDTPPLGGFRGASAVANAATMLRNAKTLMRRAMELGLV